MSSQSSNLFQPRDSPGASSATSQEFSLPLRGTQSATNISNITPDSSPLAKKTTQQPGLFSDYHARPVFGFGVPHASTTPPNPSRPRGLDRDRSPATFSFTGVDRGNKATSETATTSTLPSQPPSSPAPAISSDTSDPASIFGYKVSKTPEPVPVFNFAVPSSSDVFGFEAETRTNFTFRVLHNVTPVPSRPPSPGASPPNNPGSSSSWASPLTPRSSQSPVMRDRSPSQTPNSLRVPLSPFSPALSSTDSLSGAGRSTAGIFQRARSVSEVSAASDMQPDAVPPYDLRDEETPQHRFFSPEFQSALQKGLGIAKDTVEAIEKLDGLVTDSTLSKFLQTAKRLRVFHGSDTRTIAVLGDSGEGKSSLINSLLHFPGVAKTGDIGSACTSVVTEYRQKTSEHTAPITIEVEYLSTPEIEALLKELLWSYRQLYLPDIESDKTLPEDYARYQRQSAQAWSALEAAFKHKGEFKPERLQDMSDGALDRITTELIRWSEEIEWPEGGVNGLWRSTANTTEECCEKTEIFMKDKYWPFTKIIRIYLNAQVLKTGVVLADLPGLQDTNLARVRATQDYLMRCNNIFIVAKISRAITDQSLKTSLFTVLARQVPLEWDESAAKSLNVAVVCTKSEDINLETARREFCGTGKKIPLAVVQQLDQEIDDAKRAGNAALKKQLKLRRELLFIGARNQHVKEGLQTAYASKVPDRKLEVFCVSNKLYEKYTRKGNSDVVRASVIPELRKFCHSITAEAQLQEARHFLQSSLFSLLNSLYMWATSSLMETGPGTGESKEQIIEKLKKATKSWTKALRGLRRDFMLCFEEQILKMMENRYDAWETAADQEGREWDSWHWTQYKAWCLNNGDHETAKRGRVDWNAKIIWKMRTELEFQWDIVEEEISSLFGDLLTKLKSLLNSVKETILESCPSEFRDSLVDGINARIRHCDYEISLAEQRFTREIKLTRRYASESNENSFVRQRMLPAYREASKEFGRGQGQRLQGIVQGRITDGALFPDISFDISERVKGIVERTDQELQDLLRRTVKEVEEDVDIALSDLPDTSMSAEKEDKLKELLSKVSKLKDEAEAVGRLAAE